MIRLKQASGRWGLTLIELLIVVAIMSIMVVATANIFFYSHREQARLQQELDLQQSINLTLQSLALDAAHARESLIISENELAMIMSAADDLPQKVSYKNREGSLFRITMKDNAEHSQLMANDVKDFNIKSQGNLISIGLALERRKYNTTFSRSCEAAFYMGGVR